MTARTRHVHLKLTQAGSLRAQLGGPQAVVPPNCYVRGTVARMEATDSLAKLEKVIAAGLPAGR